MKKEFEKLHEIIAEDLGLDEDSLLHSFANHVEHTQGKDCYSVTTLDLYQSLAHTVRDRLFDRWNKTQQSYYRPETRRIYYLSLEFLVGRLLRDAMINLGVDGEVDRMVGRLGLDLARLEEEEWDAGLGNGGLGRLAACFLDSLATLGLPAIGCGIRYEYGIFRQGVINGRQVEAPDNWLRYGNVWEIPRPEYLYPVKFGGQLKTRVDETGREIFDWCGTEEVMAMAYDVPVPGYRNGVVNTLRLWSAKASREFDFANFNRGDYLQAVQDKNASENISRVLYPNDKVLVGRELRLKQEYFFVSATLQDAIRRHRKTHPQLSNLHEKAVFQLNDTHPALAVPELMRLLIDEHRMGWDEAWEITRRAFAYTNHTVLPEALETWPVAMLGRILPRHLVIIFEINHRFLQEIRQRFPGDEARVQRMSIVAEGAEQAIRMANLAIVGSSSVNGVSALHSQLLRDQLFADFAELWPGKFNNKTNGVTPRRWLRGCNPELARVISERLGEGWITDLDELQGLAAHADDGELHEAWRAVKHANKVRLAERLLRDTGLTIDPATLLDVQVKRIHEYKRQLLNALHALKLYQDLTVRGREIAPRTILFAGKAAPGYEMAKRIVHLIHAIGNRINNDPAVRGRLKVVFAPNYCVSLAEIIIPAAELSEQISTAGTEASGTGNMKLALNGALTIGTLDGANIEIRDAVGDDNIFVFGLTEPEVAAIKRSGYDPRRYYEGNPQLKAVLDLVASGELTPDEPSAFWPVVDSLLVHGDPYLVLADFAAYCRCQERIGQLYGDRAGWTRRSILNVANMGRFSSDATIAAYAREIWGQALERK